MVRLSPSTTRSICHEPNEGTYAEDMYENGNKICSMGGSTIVDGDGDINKMVGIMA